MQPASLSDLANIQSVAAVTVVNTTDVTIENIAIDASDNGLSGCTPTLSAVHFFNSSGRLIGNAISGARIRDLTSCDPFIGNGFGVLIDRDGSLVGPWFVRVDGDSIYGFTRNGGYASGSGLGVDVIRKTLQG